MLISGNIEMMLFWIEFSPIAVSIFYSGTYCAFAIEMFLKNGKFVIAAEIFMLISC